jgi:hypothetical protein
MIETLCGFIIQEKSSPYSEIKYEFRIVSEGDITPITVYTSIYCISAVLTRILILKPKL